MNKKQETPQPSEPDNNPRPSLPEPEVRKYSTLDKVINQSKYNKEHKSGMSYLSSVFSTDDVKFNSQDVETLEIYVKSGQAQDPLFIFK